MTSPNAAPIAEIPFDDAELDLILKTGIHGGFWPFATLPGSLPMSVILRVGERVRILQEADAAVAAAAKRNRAEMRESLLALLGGGIGDATSAVAGIPGDDMTLDALLKGGLEDGRWPFETPLYEMSSALIGRISARVRALREADAELDRGIRRTIQRVTAKQDPSQIDHRAMWICAVAAAATA